MSTSDTPINLQDGLIWTHKLNYYGGSIVLLEDICGTLGLSCFGIALLIVLVYFTVTLNNYLYSKYSSSFSSPESACSGPSKHTVTSDEKKDCNVDDGMNSFLHPVTHLAVIMDGNRRYGKKCCSKLENAMSLEEIESFCKQISTEIANNSGKTNSDSTFYKCTSWFNDRYEKFSHMVQFTFLDGHRLGSEKLLEFIKDCIEARIAMLTVYAFSTNNWDRPVVELQVLTTLFLLFFGKIRSIIYEYGIFIRFVSTEPKKLPIHLLKMMEYLECDSRHISPRCITLNICVSYSGQSEMVMACNRIFKRRMASSDTREITKDEISSEMLHSITQSSYEEEDKKIFTSSIPREPQLILRTSGEKRISDFLLYECAYSEFEFISKKWPEITKSDLKNALLNYLKRNRRHGK
ncbi:unnamed protein product [Phytomonas sp. Hart1]|nr:unnamed protein product [Phytomonas sp. Hart1]|eukprot:CCW71161.1 unnamed protein product [Phytomonas sp. isolate Hart1]